EAMRRILIENVRRKKSQKYGGNRKKVEFNEDLLVSDGEIPSDDLLALEEALNKFSQNEPLIAKLVNLRFFAGLTSKQAAEVLGISHNTADKYWRYARSWLRLEIAQSDASDKE
ncbi:MAG: RNA polymerase subunit sigma, partial [Phycisphaerae bacterium]|nr:RNA polymerase subunit sigma [Phycisphaerae bacterium]